MEKLFEKFKLDNEREKIETIISTIYQGVTFRGTNLWILIFAIFVASLGLNVNSPAVIIGAMLISPLMGPIMGLGLGVGVNDLSLVRKAIYNYLVATSVALTTSTLFFLVSPLDDAHSEILARTAPNIYDVLIALFGGLAGIIATSSRNKGNVIPGVAIATALMPPLCTAGYGLATLQFNYFFGAFYLFIINTVFIALATFVIVRIMHFPSKHFQNERSEKVAKRIVWLVVLLTILPSLYFGYDLVKQNRFTKNANKFILNEAYFPNDYMLNKKIDPKGKSIVLIYGGNEIKQKEIDHVKKQLKYYNIEDAKLEIKQGFTYLATENPTNNTDINQLSAALDEGVRRYNELKTQTDSIENEHRLSRQVYAELKAQYSVIQSAVIQPSFVINDSSAARKTYLVILSLKGGLSTRERNKISSWIKVRLSKEDITLVTR